jgi:hypothetical protein
MAMKAWTYKTKENKIKSKQRKTKEKVNKEKRKTKNIDVHANDYIFFMGYIS